MPGVGLYPTREGPKVHFSELLFSIPLYIFLRSRAPT